MDLDKKIEGLEAKDRTATGDQKASLDAALARTRRSEALTAFETTLPFGSMNFENKTDKHGQRLIWLDRAVLDRLRSLSPVPELLPEE